MLPATTIDGIADNRPVIMRPIRTATIDGIAAIIIQKIVQSKVEKIAVERQYVEASRVQFGDSQGYEGEKSQRAADTVIMACLL